MNRAQGANDTKMVFTDVTLTDDQPAPSPAGGEQGSTGYEGGYTLREREVPMHTANVESESLLTPAEVASLFRVDPKTVTRWARSGKLSAVRTLGGHRRYRESEVLHLLSGVPVQRDERPAVLGS